MTRCTRDVAVELEEALMDFLHDGEAPISDAAHEMRKSPTVLMRVASRLKEQGLLDSRICRSHYGRPETRWFHLRTKRLTA